MSKIAPSLYPCLALALVLAVAWGFAWAWFLNTDRGLWLARRRTWLTVVVGVDLLILPLVLGIEEWLFVCAVIAASSIGIVIRSWNHEHHDEEAGWRALEKTARE